MGEDNTLSGSVLGKLLFKCGGRDAPSDGHSGLNRSRNQWKWNWTTSKAQHVNLLQNMRHSDNYHIILEFSVTISSLITYNYTFMNYILWWCICTFAVSCKSRYDLNWWDEFQFPANAIHNEMEFCFHLQRKIRNNESTKHAIMFDRMTEHNIKSYFGAAIIWIDS